MLKRYTLSAVLAAAVTFGLFFLMQSLIAMGEGKMTEENVRRVIEFVRVKHESQLETKKRELPQKQQAQDEPPPPAMDLPQSGGPGATAVNISAPPIESNVHLSGGPQMAAAPSDMNITPLVRVEPTYPRSAQERRIEGWVFVELTISVTGTVKDPHVLASEPPGVFDRAVLNAVRKWKYKPRVENGVPVETPGVQFRLTFKLDNGG